MGVWSSGRWRGTVNPHCKKRRGSNPLTPTKFGILAQLAEQVTVNH